MQSKELLIDQLVDSDFDYIMQTGSGLELLRDYLQNGFKGYANFTKDELLIELDQRKTMKAI